MRGYRLFLAHWSKGCCGIFCGLPVAVVVGEFPYCFQGRTRRGDDEGRDIGDLWGSSLTAFT
jgi:hypothetical protein